MRLTRSGVLAPGAQRGASRPASAKHRRPLPQLSTASRVAGATDRRNHPLWQHFEVYDGMVLLGVLCESIAALTSIHIDRKLILLLPFIAVTMALLRSDKLHNLDRTRLPVGLLCFLAWTALSLLWTDNPSSSLSADIEYFLTSIAGIALACALTQMQVIRVFALSTKFFVVLAIVTFVVAPHFATEAAASNAPGFRGPFGNKNSFGFLMASGLLALLFERPVTRHNKVWVALTVALLLASQGGTAWVGISAVLAMLAWLHLWRGRKEDGSRLVIASWTVALLGGAALITATDFPFLTHLIGKGSSLTGRTRIWNAVISAIATRPIEGFGFGEVADADGAAGDLVFVGGANAAAGGADLHSAGSVFRRQFDHAMVRKNDMRAVGDKQLAGYVHPERLQPVDLLQKGHRVQHHTVADDCAAVRAQHAAGDQLQDELFAADDDRVSGIMAARITRHDGKASGEDIDDFSLAFVAPLGTQDHGCFSSH